MAEDVSSIIKESIDGVLQSQHFNAQKVCIAPALDGANNCMQARLALSQTDSAQVSP